MPGHVPGRSPAPSRRATRARRSTPRAAPRWRWKSSSSLRKHRRHSAGSRRWPSSPPSAFPGVYFLPAPRPAAVGLAAARRRRSGRLRVARTARRAGAGRGSQQLSMRSSAARSRLPATQAVSRSTAYLRDAVASFFSCGGRRCYVVSGRRRRGRAGELRVPGMIAIERSACSAVPKSTPPRPACGARRCDSAPIATVTPLPPAAFTVLGGTALNWLTTGATEAVAAGRRPARSPST